MREQNKLVQVMTDAFISVLLQDLQTQEFDAERGEGTEAKHVDESPELREKSKKLISVFVALHHERINFEAFKEGYLFNSDSPYRDAEKIASDLYLTLAGHGAGFWDGGYAPEAESAFMAFCEPQRKLERDHALYDLTAWVQDVYADDNGLVYP
jgi:hypothetical protein